MAISASMVKDLRESTGVGMMDCKNALKETNGDFEKAVEYLRKKGLSKAAKKADRDASEGFIGSYVHHNGKLAVLVEVNCETDFVAKTDDFQDLVKNLSMHIAASNPLYVKSEEVPAEVIEKEKEIIKAQLAKENKPENIIEKIVEGRVNKYFSENCLLHQVYVKDDKKSIQDIVNENISKLGENIVVRRFVRFVIGENK
ncbi:MAG: translation elongation factor Ts [Candidatus Muirbacterium halophilum]|nr:translation elongation factor Ts [Candidatus Muirbacterium halophilum]MCK9475325.1 translation elongation factor Ts [Candidatus Muirbacterium halophilum]